MGVIEKCSLQYDFKYGAQKQPELVQFAESRVGVAVHSALEHALRGLAVDRALLHAKDDHGLTSAECEELDARAAQIARFVSRMAGFKKKHGVSSESIEEKWGMNAGFTKAGFFDGDVFFRGVVDLAYLTGAGDLVIIDHKSGKQRELTYYDTQLRVYALMGLARFPHIRGVQTAINFVMPDAMAWAPYVPAHQIRDEYQPWLVGRMNDACQGLLTEPKPSKSKLCDWCGYRPICPAHREVTSGPAKQP
jgi:RecB family exonuclease